MKNSLLITKYILDILKQNTELMKIISIDKFYPIDAKLSSSFPFAVILRTQLIPSSSKDGIYMDIVKFSVIIVDNTYIGSVTIADAVRNALDRHKYKSDEVNISYIKIEGASEGYYNDAYVQELNFSAEFNVN